MTRFLPAALVFAAAGVALGFVLLMGALTGFGASELRFGDNLADLGFWRDALQIPAALVLAYLLFKTVTPERGLSIMVKRYGNTRQQRLDDPFEFELAGLRDDEEEIHTFRVVQKADTLMATRFMNVSDDRVMELFPLIISLISKMLDNKDGVGANWAPLELPKPANAGPKYQPKFRGPDGKLHPMDQAAKFEDYNAGSSRRRWRALVVDNEFTVDVEALADIARDLIEQSTGRPTDES